MLVIDIVKVPTNRGFMPLVKKRTKFKKEFGVLQLSGHNSDELADKVSIRK